MWVLGALAAAAGAGATVAPRVARAQGISAETQAHVRFEHGRQLFLAHDYAGALAEFRATNELAASPNTRLYIARCLRETGHFAEAYVEFRSAGAEAADRAAMDPRYGATRDAARSEGQALEGQLGRLTVHVPHAPEGVVVTVGGAPLAAAGWEVATPVDAGAVEVAATAPGRVPFRQRITVDAGRTMDVTVELAVDPNATSDGASTGSNGSDTERPPNTGTGSEENGGVRREVTGGGVRAAGFVLGALGVGGGIAFAVFGAMAGQRYHDLTTACGGAHACEGATDAQIAQGETYQTLANVGLGVGIAGLAIGTVMIIVGGPHVVEHPAATTGARNDARRRASAGVGGLTVWGAPLGAGAGMAGVRGAF